MNMNHQLKPRRKIFLINACIAVITILLISALLFHGNDGPDTRASNFDIWLLSCLTGLWVLLVPYVVKLLHLKFFDFSVLHGEKSQEFYCKLNLWKYVNSLKLPKGKTIILIVVMQMIAFNLFSFLYKLAQHHEASVFVIYSLLTLGVYLTVRSFIFMIFMAIIFFKDWNPKIA
ncbi:TPA: hypothetical protein ACGIK9_003362 [Acinetobacter baumannii]|uniref:hypothetical protein n=1 Tax=Acinetobacter baumannii TaxID=470 RepID=UPI00338EE2D2